MNHKPGELEFEEFVGRVEPGLRRALFAALGLDHGREATTEALAWAWEHWSKVQQLDNVTGYLFRVGQSRTRRRRTPPVFIRSEWNEPWVEPKLIDALSNLTEAQRLAVVLICGFGWTMQEVGDLTGIKATSVQNHLERGLRSVRSTLGVYENE